MWLKLPDLWIILLNALGIPIVHLAIAWLATALPGSFFYRKTSNHRFLKIEKSGWLYHRAFHIRKWKKYLPDAAPWFEGFSKANLKSTDLDYLKEFITETRRGEWSHWIQSLLIAVFILWTPMPGAWVIIIYSILANFPCILNLRYTRLRLLRVIAVDSNQ
jgi:glycosyl-4,4'-diaponeurosporenoate acyltransferase